MSISFYDCGTSTILVLPLTSMHEEYQFRAKKYGLTCRTWTSDCSISTVPQLLLVSVETCTWPDLQALIATLACLGRLARIVVDEAHLLVKHELFRPCMTMLFCLGKHAISIVLMTATCPPPLEKELFQRIGRKVYRVLRRSTDRPEISQHFVQLEGDQADFEEEVVKKIVSTVCLSKSNERALLFCNSRDECDRMAKLLEWKPYHSSVPIEDRSKAMKVWKDGRTAGLVCTSMLNCCLDYSDVRYLFHLGPPRDVVDYYQAIGRLARGGGDGTSVVYFNPAFLRKRISDTSDPFGQQVILDVLSDNSLCRRLRPAFFLDGIGVPCTMLPHAQLCDVCVSQLGCQPSDQDLHHFPVPSPPKPSPYCPIQLRSPPGTLTQPATLPEPHRRPAPLATFAHHLAAANAHLAVGRVSSDEDPGRSIRIACGNLVKSCANCWCNGFEYHSHSLAQCPCKPVSLHGENWKKWVPALRFPVGCCFYCGCPQKVRGCTTTLHLSVSYISFRWLTRQRMVRSFESTIMKVIRTATGLRFSNLLHTSSSSIPRSFKAFHRVHTVTRS